MVRASVSIVLISVVLVFAVVQSVSAQWNDFAFQRAAKDPFDLAEDTEDIFEEPQRQSTRRLNNFNSVIRVRQQKRGGEDEPRRLCGGRLIQEIGRICGNCYGTLGRSRIGKRAVGQMTVTKKCCEDKCTDSWIKANLCCFSAQNS
uniref:IlGF domain-containing protein n=1 Tax=Steinernema glaseri TaxID=37863 RepID=A0A1I7Y7A8_9BILA